MLNVTNYILRGLNVFIKANTKHFTLNIREVIHYIKDENDFHVSLTRRSVLNV